MKKSLLFLILCSISYSCSDRNTGTPEAESRVIQDGDIDAFSALLNTYDTKCNSYKMLPFALKMQKQGLGCYTFYENHMKVVFDNKFDSKNIEKLEKPEKEFLIHILQKGANADDPSCKKQLIEYYKNGWGVAKNSQKADSIFATFEYPKT